MDYSTISLGLGIIFAFFGGLVSFISPCVLPLVPAYIGYMGGRVTQTVAAQVSTGNTQAARASRWNTLMNGVAFVAGFTLVFVLFGLLTTAFIRAVSGAHVGTLEGIIGRIGGVVIILLGLHFMGVLPKLFAWLRARPKLLNNLLVSVVIALLGAALFLWGFMGTLVVWDGSLWEQARTYGTLWAPLAGVIITIIWLLVLFLGGAFFAPGAFWRKAMNTIEFSLYTDTRRQMAATGQQGLLGSALMGIVFAAGWTPCIGPIYGGILTASASLTRSVAESAVWLTAYCIGLGVPFLLTALMLDRAQGLLRRLQRHMHKIELVTGIFLVVIGISVASGRLQFLSQQFAGQFAEFSVAVEGWAQRNLEQLLGIPSSANESSQTSEQQLSTENAIRLDGTPSAGDQDSPLALVVEDAANEPLVGLAPGNRAPNFVADTDEGSPIALYDLRGKVVLLHFWSSACEACPTQIQTYQALVDENADFAVVALSGGALSQTLANYRQQWGISFALLMDADGAIHNLYNVSVYPDNYLINREGLIVRRFSDLPIEQIRSMVSGILASP